MCVCLHVHMFSLLFLKYIYLFLWTDFKLRNKVISLEWLFNKINVKLLSEFGNIILLCLFSLWVVTEWIGNLLAGLFACKAQLFNNITIGQHIIRILREVNEVYPDSSSAPLTTWYSDLKLCSGQIWFHLSKTHKQVSVTYWILPKYVDLYLC